MAAQEQQSRDVSQSGGVPGGGISGTFPRGLLGVLRIRALVRDVNLLASSVGSSCQLLLESSSPSWLRLCKRRWEGVAILSHLTFISRSSAFLPPGISPHCLSSRALGTPLPNLEKLPSFTSFLLSHLPGFNPAHSLDPSAHPHPNQHPYRPQGHKHRATPCHQCHGLITVKKGLDDDDLVQGSDWLGSAPP